MPSTKSTRTSFLAALAAAGLLGLSLNASAEEGSESEGGYQLLPPPPDTSRWRCRNCEFHTGWIGSILFGAGYVSDDLFEFGNYRGLEDDGFFGEFAVDLLYRSEEGHYLEVLGERLGLDSRTVAIDGGKQGQITGWLTWNEIPVLRDGTTQTIFLGAGTSDQRLPADWVRESTTDRMPLLDQSLRDVNIRYAREILGLGFAVDKWQHWQYRASVERTTQQGRRIKGGSFVFTAAELAAPINYETINFETALAYVRDTWDLEAAYELSLFDNRNQFLRFENPFLGINGADVGQLAEPPDNEFHQVIISGSWRPQRWFSLAGQVAFGRLEQDDAFLSPTLNPLLVNPGLPRADLDGEIDTRVVNLRAAINPTRKLRASVQFQYDERDNDTPRDSFVQVVSDTFVIDPRINKPFSHERISVGASVDYRVLPQLRLGASVRHQEMERDLQEVEDTDTQVYTLRARATPHHRLNLNLELSREERDNDIDPALLGPRENPSLRRFHFAEKERDWLRFSADYAITSNFAVGAFVEIADEDYTDTHIGLSDARDESYGLDFSASFGEHVSAYAFVAFESLEADILGADDVVGAPWEANQEDKFRTLGLGVNFGRLPGKWVRAALDFTYASADGEISIVKRGVSDPDFPDLETRRFTLDAWIERELADNLNLRLAYLVERLDDEVFFIDDVGPASIPLLLSLGETSPDKTIHVVSAMLRYRF